MGYRMVTCPMRHMTLRGQTRDPNTLRAQYLENYELETSNLVCSFVSGILAGAQITFPESGRGLGHVTPQFLAVRSAILATAWLLVIFDFIPIKWYSEVFDIDISSTTLCKHYCIDIKCIASNGLLMGQSQVLIAKCSSISVRLSIELNFVYVVKIQNNGNMHFCMM